METEVYPCTRRQTGGPFFSQREDNEVRDDDCKLHKEQHAVHWLSTVLLPTQTTVICSHTSNSCHSCVCPYFTTRINQYRQLIALSRQGTQQKRPQSPTVTPPGMRVNTGHINSTKSTSLGRVSYFTK